MARVFWTESAINDLLSIVEHIAEDSSAYAKRFVMRVIEAPRRLEQFPNIGRIVPEFDDENIRELLYGTYRIIYQIRKDRCYMVAIIHSSRDLLQHVKPGEWDIT